MAVNLNPIFAKRPRFKPTVFAAADGTNWKQIFAPGTEGSRISKIIISTTKTTSFYALLRINNGTDQSILGHITINGSAGQGTVAVVSGLNRGNLPWLEIDANGNPFFDANVNMNIEMKLSASLSGTEEVNVTVGANEYEDN